MGLFGGIGKLFGGALKVAGKVAGVASAVAPIPGLGFAGKVSSGLGGLISKGRKLEGKVRGIMPGGAPTVSTVNVPSILTADPVFKPDPFALMRAGQASGSFRGGILNLPVYAAPGAGAPKKKRRRKKSGLRSYKRRRSSSSSSRRRRRGRKLSPAQLRAGFGGKRRMRGR